MQPRKSFILAYALLPVASGAKTAEASHLTFVGAAAALGTASFSTWKRTIEPNPLRNHVVTRLHHDWSGRMIYLVGTNHFLVDSAQLVLDVIRAVRPDVVVAELDQSRFDAIVRRLSRVMADATAEESADRTAAGARIKLWPWCSHLLSRLPMRRPKEAQGLKAAAPKPGVVLEPEKMPGPEDYDEFYNCHGITEGLEFMAAYRGACELRSKYVFGDRDQDAMHRRMADALRADLFESPTADADADALISKSHAERERRAGLQPRYDVPNDLKELREYLVRRTTRAAARAENDIRRRYLPNFYNVLIGERDDFLVRAAVESRGLVTVAVAGLAHLQGVEERLAAKGWRKESRWPVFTGFLEW
ncbi:unnamed protein product [Phaeothamnion confervicola]